MQVRAGPPVEVEATVLAVRVRIRDTVMPSARMHRPWASTLAFPDPPDEVAEAGGEEQMLTTGGPPEAELPQAAASTRT